MSRELINNYYYVAIIVVMLASFAVFFFSYERKKPKAREIVTLAVMSAIAVASRAVFVMIPFFKPMSGIIMITGMAFGPGAGFLVGSVSAFVSNFIFGQGPWTPWQMLAYALAGLLAGAFRKIGFIHENKKIRTAIIGALMIVIIVGPLLDVCAIFTTGNALSKEFALATFASGFIPNVIHAVATALTLFLLCRPMLEKLNRMKMKYGMMENEEEQ